MLTKPGVARVQTNSALQQDSDPPDHWIADPGINGKPDAETPSLGVLLSRFESHGLGEINHASLMHRVDTKYLLPIRDLEKLLMLLAPFYTVLEIDALRLFSYQNAYFDTPGYGFYLMHHNGKLNRFKIRQRLYVESGDLYVEVKHKTNKRVTQKDRVLIDGNTDCRDRIEELVSKPFGGSSQPLFKSLVCSYTRIALADEKNGERLSLDFNLSFKDPNHPRIKQSNQVLIAEVKRANRKVPSVFMDRMSHFRQKPVSFSKYCIGCALMHANCIKINRFKTTVMALDRISNLKTGIGAWERNEHVKHPWY